MCLEAQLATQWIFPPQPDVLEERWRSSCPVPSPADFCHCMFKWIVSVCVSVVNISVGNHSPSLSVSWHMLTLNMPDHVWGWVLNITGVLWLPYLLPATNKISKKLRNLRFTLPYCSFNGLIPCTPAGALMRVCRWLFLCHSCWYLQRQALDGGWLSENISSQTYDARESPHTWWVFRSCKTLKRWPSGSSHGSTRIRRGGVLVFEGVWARWDMLRAQQCVTSHTWASQQMLEDLLGFDLKWQEASESKKKRWKIILNDF